MSFRPFNGVVNDPRSISVLVTESMIIGLLAIILGSIIDKIFKNISKKVKRFKILISILQIMVSTIVTALIYMYGPAEFSRHFQRTLPGMLFPALLYGVQSNIYSSWQEI